MSFLRSVIADARPRKPMLEPSNSPSAITGWKSRGLDGDVSGAEEISPSAPDQTSRLSTSLPIREGASDFNTRDAPAFQADNPVNLDIQDMASNVEPESPLSVPVDESGPLPDEESSTRLDPGNHPDRESGSEGASNVEPESSLSVPVGKSGPLPDEESSTRLDPGNHPDRESGSEGDKASEAEGSMTSQPAGTVIPDSGMNVPMSQGHDLAIAIPETHDAQKRASGQEMIEPVSSAASIGDTLGEESTDNDGNSALQAEESAGQLGLHETTSSAVEGNTPAQDEVAGATAADDRHHSESSTKGPETLTIQADVTPTTALTSPESSRRIEPSVLKASLVPTVPSPDASGNPTLDTAAAAKGVLRDAQLVSRQAMAMDSPLSSDMELASVPQSTGTKVSTSASSPGSGSSKPSSPVQHIARPARPSASPEALRSVPARPLQTDLMPRDGDSFHSRAPLRSPEKKHEAPKVQIGQIDVIIEAAAQPVTKQAPAPSPVDLASRHYLRRL